MTSLKTTVFEWSKSGYRVLSRRWIFLTIGAWLGFFFFSLLGKNHNFSIYIVIRIKNENCEFLQNLCTDFAAALQKKITA